MERKYTCDCGVIHESAVEAARAHMGTREDYQKLADLFKMFGDCTRVQILHALEHHELCVCDLAVLLGITKSAVSHQLKALRLSNLVKFRREGQIVYYSLSDDHVQDIMEKGMSHIHE